MKGKIARAAAALLAVLLAAGYAFLPGVERRSETGNSGRQKWALEDGDSASWSWAPVNGDCQAVSLRFSGLKKAQGLTLTAVLSDAGGAELASRTQALSELEDEDGFVLSGDFRTGQTYTLTAAAQGEGRISLRGEEDEDGTFHPGLTEIGETIHRNPVLLYFAAGLLLLAAVPVGGPDADLRRRNREKSRELLARLLPWGTFLLIAGVGLLVDLRKPTWFMEPKWGTWDEQTHAYWVTMLSMSSEGGLRGCLNRMITWYPGYLPLTLGFDLGALISPLGAKDPELPYRLSVIVSTLTYAGMCALAVRRAPRFKVSFLAAGSIPMMIFQATSMTYDTAVTGGMLLGAALLLETLDSGERLSAGRAITLAALFSLGTVTKPAYSLMLLALWMIPGKQYGSRREKWGFRIFSLVMTVWCFAAMAMPGAYDNVLSGDERFLNTDAGAQVQAILADPLGKGLLPFRFLWKNLVDMTVSWLDFWAYVGYGLPGLADLYLAAMLVVAPLCACGERWDRPSPLYGRRRIGMALIALAAEIILIYAQYIASSPLGGPIQGMQPRYFTPFFALALMALMWPQAVRRRVGRAGDVLTVALYAVCLWMNVENALLHLTTFAP